MSLESFYGGKQGISPVIRNSFQYVDANDPAYQAALKAGATAASLAPKTMDITLADSNYEDVWYNELCIIDTRNKANKNNGKVYRRTLKGRGDADLVNRSAEYIGQIVGPAGANPFMSLGSLSDVKDKANEDYTVNDDTVINWPNSKTTTSSVKPAGGINPYIFDAAVTNSMIVPGKDGDKYNDSIRYTWFNMVDNTTEEETQSIVYLGFEIPYPSIDMAVENVDWNEEVKISKRTGTGYKEHPFYHFWDINIPRGVRGNAAGNIRTAKYKDFRNTSLDTTKPFLYDFEKSVVEVNSQRGVFQVNEVTPEAFTSLTAQDKSRLAETPFWVYDYTFYDKAQNSTQSIKTYTFYLGSYREIKDVLFADDGTVTFVYSDTTQDEFKQKIQWVKNIAISATGVITFTYNTDTNGVANTYTKQLPYPDSVKISDEGVLTIYFKDNTSFPITTSWEGGSTPFDLNYVKTITMDTDTKVLGYTTYPKNNGTTLNNGVGINYVTAMTVDDKYHLVAYYGSSQFRPTVSDVAAGTKNGSPVTVINKEDNVNYVSWNGQTFRDGIIYTGIPENGYWQDLGLMREVMQGIRVLSEIDLSAFPNPDVIKDYTVQQFIDNVLNPQYWDAQQTISNPYYGGQIGNELDYNGDPLRGTFCYTLEVANGSAYYYDYDKHSWKYAGAWGEADKTDVDITLKEGKMPGEKELSDSGIMFFERATNKVTNSLPTPWR